MLKRVQEIEGVNRRSKSFRYENMWRRESSYTPVVESTWTGSGTPSSLAQLVDNLGRVSSSLSTWARDCFGSVKRELQKARAELENVWRASMRSGPTLREKQLMKRISKLLSRKEIMMKQRSRIDWLKEGDRNTAFFHAKARECSQSQINQISALKREDGSVVTTQEEVETEAMEFYAKLFTRQEVLDPDPILDHVPIKVTPLMNDYLMRPFTGDEVREAVFMMGASKAPGPNGLSAGFFQYHWDTVGDGVIAVVLDFLNGGEMPESMNSTTIVLIPKIKHPQEMKQFQPISLCNVVYKICSKMFANRMRGFFG